MIAINSAYDHIHMFIGVNPKQAISDLMRLVKGDSSEFININSLTDRKFYWQEGYGAFTSSRSHIDAVVKYILNQKEHHQKRNFREEYLEMLKVNDVSYDEKYIFHTLQDD